MYQNLVANLSRGVRRENRDGREYLIAPLTMICPGVLHGSQGALYYPPDEIARSTEAWNGVPITVNHPRSLIGEQGDANADDPLQRQGIGVVQNARMGRCLRADGWFDVAKTKQVDNRVYESLIHGQCLELSTGLYLDERQSDDGESTIAINYRPDHLAILPDQVGACSLQDGCGVLVNQRGETMNVFDAVARGTRKTPLPSHEEIVASLEAEQAGRVEPSSADVANAPRRRVGPTPLPSNAEYEQEMGLT